MIPTRDRQGLDPNVWGPDFWDVFHYIFESGNNLSSSTQKLLPLLFVAIETVLPCSKCRVNYKHEMDVIDTRHKDPPLMITKVRQNRLYTPVRPWVIANLFYCVHNEVRKRQNKPPWPEDRRIQPHWKDTRDALRHNTTGQYWRANMLAHPAAFRGVSLMEAKALSVCDCVVSNAVRCQTVSVRRVLFFVACILYCLPFHHSYLRDRLLYQFHQNKHLISESASSRYESLRTIWYRMIYGIVDPRVIRNYA
jgi:hypothetical protein